MLAGCGGNGDTAGGDEEEVKYTIGVSLPTVKGPFFTALTYGIMSRAEELGVDTVVLDAGGYKYIDNQISYGGFNYRKVDGILLDPADDKTLLLWLMKLLHNIQVVGTGSPIDNDNVISCVTVDHTELGRKWLVT